MSDRVFYDADGELLIVPQDGQPAAAHRVRRDRRSARRDRGHPARRQIPRRAARRARRGLCLRELRRAVPAARTRADRRQRPRQSARLPDARAPRSKTRDGPCQLVAKFEGHLWATELDHSPLDVVAWHGNYAPYKYDLARFNTIGTVSFDHPDPSIFTVLTSPTETPGTANCDFVIFPPRWMVAEHTFRPPFFHRNYMSEFMGLVRGAYDAKATGFVPGGMSLHNCMSAHGPDRATFDRAVAADLEPQKIDDTLAFMFETRLAAAPDPLRARNALPAARLRRVLGRVRKQFPGLNWASPLSRLLRGVYPGQVRAATGMRVKRFAVACCPWRWRCGWSAAFGRGR